ncbi:glycosyltransferase family 2 protein [Pseudozobellia thermophila]|uniref:Glycosyltransferase involved in cell wall bisynthesis n=1 Tax=Pseudozobellia thermophila TaxID=192903 RepID=A0A1M6IVU3_9FLAO|nr:glycosyltransferase family 2 protein [Pseudozobellia thermophila]SHJ38538.1 Glycosyltransferase involved in cell wall bisynthesis [Pseudozobellia thermophila]
MFSILTPTHNRANVIERVYNSLKHQTYKDFEWIIIDDASIDNTEEIVNKWQAAEKNFNIIYHKLPQNLGKAPVVNFGIDLCSRPITIIADDDDTFVSSTLEDLKLIWNTIDKTENSEQIAAVWTLVQDERGKIIGEKFPADFWQVNFQQRVLDRNRPPIGEKWHSWRTNVLKTYKMYNNENSFVSEGATWNRINKDYDFLCVNLVHRIYWYSENGLIHKKKSRLSIEKNQYYTSYFQLKDLSVLTILKYSFYRGIAFNFVKAFYFYRDKTHSLKWSLFLASIVAFFVVLPQKVLYRLTNA